MGEKIRAHIQAMLMKAQEINRCIDAMIECKRGGRLKNSDSRAKSRF